MRLSDILKCLGFWILLIVLANSGCIGSEGGEETPLSTVRLAMSEAFLENDIELVRMTVSGDGMDTLVREMARDEFGPGGAIAFELDVPAGQYRTFSAAAFMLDEQDEYYTAYEGEEVVHLEAGKEKQIDMTLYGRAYLSGHVYFLEQSAKEVPWRPGALYANGSGSITIDGTGQFASEFTVDGNGHYEVKLETRPENYQVRIETSTGDSSPWETYATVELHEGGDRIEVDLYLIPADNTDQPWITAAVPGQGASGDWFTIFGKGFWPEPQNRPIFANFSFGSGVVQAELEQDQENDASLRVKVPDDVNPGDAEFYIAWQDNTKSDYVPFAILP